MLERVEPDSVAWNDLYADHVPRYLYAAPFVRGKRVLDVGTGPGYGARLLADLGASFVQALDVDPEVVKKAHERFGAEGVRFVVDDAHTLSKVERPIDVICSFENIEHLPRPEEFVRAAAGVLGDHGILLCSTPDRTFTDPYVDGKPSNKFHMQEWYRQEFKELMSRHFRVVDYKVQAISRSLERRQEAARALTKHLDQLWASPAVRAARAIDRLIDRSNKWESVHGLAAPSIGDYPIVEPPIADLIGRPFCHYVICTNRVNGLA